MTGMLDFDFEDVAGEQLVGGLGIGPVKCSDNSVVYDQVHVALRSGVSLIISVDKDTDELVVTHSSMEQTLKEAVRISLIDDFAGSTLTWCWCSSNCRGYEDMFVVSFFAIEPQLAFVAEASKISLYRLQRV